jgi:DNA polymerase III subunit delta'
MPFSDFIGNQKIITALRGMLANERVPNAFLFTGARGVGKYTLARMFAQAANCERLRDDFCGECTSCRKIAELADTAPLIERGLAERGESADAATVERVPLILQTHPDVWAIVPDPVRLKTPVARPVIHVGQLRAVQRAAYFKPTARRRVFILDGAETMRWDLSNVFLKILEEPPESATLILLAPSPYQLLPTIVSRCFQFFFAPLSQHEVEAALAARTKLAPAARITAAQLAEGSLGVALSLDVERELELRREGLRLLELFAGGKASDLFAQSTELTKNSDASFEHVLEILFGLLNDVLEISVASKRSSHKAHASTLELRNPPLRKALEALAARVTPGWITETIAGLDHLHSRMRRNINRQLALDGLGVSLTKSSAA